MVLLGACATEPKVGLSCPPVSILPDANRMTIYRAGTGRDLSDIAYEAQLTSFEGNCAYVAANKEQEKANKYREVSLSLRPRFRVTPGPALTGQRVTLNYFVAMPAYYPNPEGRADFSRNIDIPPTRTPVEFTDSEIQIDIPLGESRSGGDTEIYLGFALTEEQLKQNRGRSGGRLGP
jgi:hypothetical protein